jgi:CoA:oxalate CoA-transferase
MADRALGHLRVVELCHMVTGPYCTKLLADLGAEVVKVEAPAAGDDARRRGPFLDDTPDPELSGLFLYLNTNKLGVTLDVETDTGRGIFRNLVDQADILVQDLPPDLSERLGLSYSELKEANPRLVMTSITPFGLTGPYRDYKARELNSHHSAGEGYLLPIMSPDLSREPVKGGGMACDCLCGLSAALATLAAAYRARETGRGQHIDVSKQDVLMTMALLEIAMYANVGVVRSRLRRPLLMPLPMKCQDGYIMMSALTDREWGSVVEFMGNPAWAADARYEQWLERHLAGDEINPHMEEFVAGFKTQELFHQLQAAASAAAPANTSRDVVESPQMEARGFFAEMEHPRAGTVKVPKAAYKLSRTPWRGERPAPLLGQHNEEVYCGRLGLDKKELVRLRESGVI